jgi:hypothetical protein
MERDSAVVMLEAEGAAVTVGVAALDGVVTVTEAERVAPP